MMDENDQWGPPAAMRMMQFVWPSPAITQAVYVAAVLGISDLVKDEPETAESLAARTGTHGPSLGRLLRALASLGIFSEKDHRFANTPLSETLRSDRPDSVRSIVLMLGAPFFWGPWGDLLGSIKTGQPAFNRLYGMPFFDYLTNHPDAALIFNQSMTGGTSMTATHLVAAYDFSIFRRIVDVGGGQGALLAGILAANPKLQGVLYDLPSVVAGADALRREPVASRAEIVGGDFFERVPEGADAYVLKGIIHDWADEEAVRILKNCRRAIASGGRVLLMEGILKPPNEPDPERFMDLLMLVVPGGRQRDESNFRALLGDAGFSIDRIIPTAGPSIIEGRPI
jgi:hypothetical protein